ncbi:hypothetical protein BRADI_4g20568v3 [Brachypodium distachyon]|uniref:Uncharacterized protein n=1 Tax=Brachypodium distachyon TaxID=15368 RepID=A0A2K2CNY8_BRADI|nr:hypothetical protein BRADI_4g20568v3 [Brachypodium distachyon]
MPLDTNTNSSTSEDSLKTHLILLEKKFDEAEKLRLEREQKIEEDRRASEKRIEDILRLVLQKLTQVVPAKAPAPSDVFPEATLQVSDGYSPEDVEDTAATSTPLLASPAAASSPPPPA